MPLPERLTVDALRRLLQRCFGQALGLATRWQARVRLSAARLEETIAMSDLTSASEALVAMPLPKMLEGLGLAVATANAAMAATKGPNNTVMSVTEATIDLNIAISVAETKDTSGKLGVNLNAFSVNASYARTFSFKEEASSRISMKLVVVPAAAAPAAAGG